MMRVRRGSRSSSASDEDDREEEGSSANERDYEQGRRRKRRKTTSREPSFKAELYNGESLYNTVKSIWDGKKEQHATCEVDERGIRFITTDKALGCQGGALVSAKLFRQFSYLRTDVPSVTFKISLSILLQCLGTLGSHISDSSIVMGYFEEIKVFSLELRETNVVTECKIRTLFEQDEDEGSGFYFKDNFKKDGVQVLATCKVPSPRLRDAFSELAELEKAASAVVLISPERPFFRLSSHGQIASCIVDFPHGDESLELDCDAKVQASYRMEFIQQACKALPSATRTEIKINSQGTLSIVHEIQQSESGTKTFVEFYILADVEQEEEDEDDN